MSLVTPNPVYDDYLGTWPDNFTPLYVGISESSGRGVRGRLSSHSRGKGNKCVYKHRQGGADLWFVTISGIALIEMEALLLCLQTTNQFECNIRPESERSSKRQMEKIRAAMSPGEREFYDNLDMGEHGEGM